MHHVQPFSARVERGPRAHMTVRLQGELDIASHAMVGRMLHALLEEDASVDLDLSALTFIDLPSVRTLLDVADAARASHCRFELHDASDAVARTLDITAAARRLPLAA